MASDFQWVIQFLCFVWSVNSVSSFLDIDELKDINYGISILNTPVLVTQPLGGSGVLYLSSKYGQQYQCQFPNKAEKAEQETKQEHIAKEIGIAELLKPMESEPCLIQTKGWWSYEFCFGKHIRQFHMEDGKAVGDILLLGTFASDYQWNDTVGEGGGKTRNQLSRYHSQTYVNGSLCELTGRERQAEVRFICENDAGDYIARIDEPATCSYVLTIHTMKICHHPFLKPPGSAKPVPIVCNPVLGESDYEEYMQQQQQALQQEEEKRESLLKAELNKLDSDLTKLKHPAGSKSKAGGMKGDLDTAAVTELHKTLKKTLKDVLSGFSDDELDEIVDYANLEVNSVNDMTKLNKFIDNLKDKGSKITVEEQTNRPEEIRGDHHSDTKVESKTDTSGSEETSESNQASTGSGDGKDEASLFGGNEKRDQPEDGSTSVVTEDKSRGDNEEMDEKSKSQSEEDTNLKFSEQSDDDDELGGFKKELDEILSASKIKERLTKLRSTLEKSMRDQFDEIVDEAQEEVEQDGDHVGEVDKHEVFKQMTDTLNRMMEKLESSEKEIKTMDKEMDDIQGTSSSTKKQESTDASTEDDVKRVADSSKTASSLLDDNRVKVRVIKVNDLKKGEDSGETEGQKKFASAIKEELEKAGLDTDGRKVEVKIITTGFYDSEDDSIQILSEAETQTFSKMMMNMLGGNTAALKEAERQQDMENGYTFSWKADKRKSKKELVET